MDDIFRAMDNMSSADIFAIIEYGKSLYRIKKPTYRITTVNRGRDYKIYQRECPSASEALEYILTNRLYKGCDVDYVIQLYDYLETGAYIEYKLDDDRMFYGPWDYTCLRDPERNCVGRY